MKKLYKYNYNIYTNNLGYGKILIKSFSTLKEAQRYFIYNGCLSGFGDCGTLEKYGCCDIVKERIYL